MLLLLQLPGKGQQNSLLESLLLLCSAQTFSTFTWLQALTYVGLHLLKDHFSVCPLDSLLTQTCVTYAYVFVIKLSGRLRITLLHLRELTPFMVVLQSDLWPTLVKKRIVWERVLKIFFNSVRPGKNSHRGKKNNKNENIHKTNWDALL